MARYQTGLKDFYTGPTLTASDFFFILTLFSLWIQNTASLTRKTPLSMPVCFYKALLVVQAEVDIVQWLCSF